MPGAGRRAGRRPGSRPGRMRRCRRPDSGCCRAPAARRSARPRSLMPRRACPRSPPRPSPRSRCAWCRRMSPSRRAPACRSRRRWTRSSSFCAMARRSPTCFSPMACTRPGSPRWRRPSAVDGSRSAAREGQRIKLLFADFDGSRRRAAARAHLDLYRGAARDHGGGDGSRRLPAGDRARQSRQGGPPPRDQASRRTAATARATTPAPCGSTIRSMRPR